MQAASPDCPIMYIMSTQLPRLLLPTPAPMLTHQHHLREIQPPYSSYRLTDGELPQPQSTEYFVITIRRGLAEPPIKHLPLKAKRQP